jgi:hypothetical protein
MPLTRIRSNGLTDQNVTGPKLGIGAISANNFAVGGVTSNVLASNLQVSLVRVLELANINSTAIGGNVNIDVSNNTVYYFSSPTTANVTFNLRSNASNSLNSTLAIGQSISLAIAVSHSTTRHSANVYIDGQAQTMYFMARTLPALTAISNPEINLFGYSVIRTGLSSYLVLAGNTLFGVVS